MTDIGRGGAGVSTNGRGRRRNYYIWGDTSVSGGDAGCINDRCCYYVLAKTGGGLAAVHLPPFLFLFVGMVLFPPWCIGMCSTVGER